MSAPDRAHVAEPERYELQEVTLRAGGGASRREFLRVLGGGLVVVLVTRDALAVPRLGAAAPGVRERLTADAGDPDGSEAIGAWLHIDEHGGIAVYTGKVEIGQGIRTSLAAELAEELRVPLASVGMIMGDTDLVPFDMGTFGSRSHRKWVRSCARSVRRRARRCSVSRPSAGTWIAPRSPRRTVA